MSRHPTATEQRVRELEAEVKQWRDAYRELALAMARRDGYATPPQVVPLGVTEIRASSSVVFPSGAPLPSSVLAAIEETTEPFSEARTMAIESARALLENGAQPEDVEAEIRQGEDIKV